MTNYFAHITQAANTDTNCERACIETMLIGEWNALQRVAPRVGAWIETTIGRVSGHRGTSPLA